MIDLLKASIRDALSENALSLSISSTCTGDPELNDHLRQLSTQIHDKSNEIVASISTILDTFDLATPLSPASSGLAHLNELLLGDNDEVVSPSVQFDGAALMQDLFNEVSAIETWEENANNLSLLVMSDFDARRKTSAVEEDAVAEIMLDLYNNDLNAIGTYRDEPPNDANGFPTPDSIWDGVYVEKSRIPNEVSLDIIKNTSLHSYLLRKDNQRNVIISEKERKTRRHIGVIEPGILFQNVSVNGKVDPTAVFSYNIGAVSQLAALHDDLSAKLKASSTFLNQDDTFHSKLQQLKESFQNPKQLVLDVATLEADEGLTRVELMKQQISHSVNLNLTLAKKSFMESHASKDASAERMNTAEREYKVAREGHLDHASASLEAVLAFLASLDDMKSIYSSTSRDLLDMVEESAVESNVAQEVIHAEADIERENEVVSINQINLLGHARIEETKEFIQNVFWNLAGCFHHAVSTSAGRQQFVFYIGVAASLVLAISTIKEIISLACAVLLRLFITPRLVREYGNLRFGMRWSSKAQTQMDSIILPRPIKERIERASKTACFARERRLPLRNILLHGNPGCGKSVTAKAIAQSIPSLPYALMSGSDVFPLGNQGPSELRRLLSWANKHGGIIIIDEAECALGKRGKAIQGDEQQQQDFSRDCLNVLLSLTGTMGNIMLILTTTNPGELDEAVLDRMDEIIHLPSLASTERTSLLRSHFSRLFELEPEQPTSFLDRMLRPIRGSTNKAHYDNKFDVKRSISDLATTAELDTCSGRELQKLLQGVAYLTYASDAGVLNQSLWARETKKLMASFTAKHKGRSIEANGLLRRTVKHEIETVKAQKRNKIQYRPELPEATDEDDDDENSLGYNEYLLGKHANRSACKRSVQANETPAKRVITRSVSKGRHARTPLGENRIHYRS